jgi:hypothetical protein
VSEASPQAARDFLLRLVRGLHGFGNVLVPPRRLDGRRE